MILVTVGILTSISFVGNYLKFKKAVKESTVFNNHRYIQKHDGFKCEKCSLIISATGFSRVNFINKDTVEMIIGVPDEACLTDNEFIIKQLLE